MVCARSSRRSAAGGDRRAGSSGHEPRVDKVVGVHYGGEFPREPFGQSGMGYRQRFLSPEETKRLMASISKDQNQAAAHAIMLLLLTGARRHEITLAKWEHVDWEKRALLVPVSKSGRPRIVALNAAALALLRSIPRDPESSHVFPSRLVGLFYPWDRIRQRAGLPDVRLHDLRHSFASFLVNQGVSLYVIQGLAWARLATHDAAVRSLGPTDASRRGRAGLQCHRHKSDHSRERSHSCAPGV
jgi:integrase